MGGAFGDVAGGVELLGDGGAYCLRAGVAVRELVVSADEPGGVGLALQKPFLVVAAAVVAVAGYQFDVVEAVEGRGYARLLARPEIGFFNFVIAAVELVALGFSERATGFVKAWARHCCLLDRRLAGEGLQVAFANERGAVTGGAQQFDEGYVALVERDAVAADVVAAGHARGHQAGAVGHAHRAGDVKAIEADAGLGEGVDVGGLQPRMPVAAEEVGAVLVGDVEDEVGTLGHVINHGFC